MDKAATGQMLQQLVAVDGPSGAEDGAADLIRSLMAPYAPEVRVDILGSVIARRPGASTPPGRIMLAAHSDEIGLMVTKVESGFLHVTNVGGVDARSVLGQEVTVYPTGPGAEAYPAGLPGFIGSRPPHVLAPAEREKVIPLRDLRVDLGRPPAFFERGIVRVGDRVQVRGPYLELMGGRIAAKALDDRASVACMIAALGYLAGMQHTWDVYAVATVQEETGMRGAFTSAYGVMPDLAIAIDVTHAEMPGVDDRETVAMDKGPAIGWGPNLHPGIVKRLRDTADALEMPYVLEILPGNSGTDAWAIQVVRQGVPCGLLSIPVRYMHSPVELAALADIDRTARLLAAFISRLDADILGALAEEV